MKFKYEILDATGKAVTAKHKTGTAVEHFAACVNICLDLLAGKGLLSDLTGGNSDINKSAVPVLFLSELHSHPIITPETFLVEWKNREIPELQKLMNATANVQSLHLFITVLNKIKIPGMKSCVVTELKMDEKLQNTAQAGDAKSAAAAGEYRGTPHMISSAAHNALLALTQKHADFKPCEEAIKNHKYGQALRIACTSKNQDAVAIVKKICDAKDILKINLNENPGQYKYTALHHAANVGNVKAYQLLLDAKADASILDSTGKTATQLLEKFITPQVPNSCKP